MVIARIILTSIEQEQIFILGVMYIRSQKQENCLFGLKGESMKHKSHLIAKEKEHESYSKA